MQTLTGGLRRSILSAHVEIATSAPRGSSLAAAPRRPSERQVRPLALTGRALKPSGRYALTRGLIDIVTVGIVYFSRPSAARKAERERECVCVLTLCTGESCANDLLASAQYDDAPSSPNSAGRGARQQAPRKIFGRLQPLRCATISWPSCSPRWDKTCAMPRLGWPVSLPSSGGGGESDHHSRDSLLIIS
jgi:hypothetical protein